MMRRNHFTVGVIVLAVLHDLGGRATAKEIAERTGYSMLHVRRALHAFEISYRTMDPIAIPIERTRAGVVWHLTEEGKRVAESWKRESGA